jgi:hypothetical protein
MSEDTFLTQVINNTQGLLQFLDTKAGVLIAMMLALLGYVAAGKTSPVCLALPIVGASLGSIVCGVLVLLPDVGRQKIEEKETAYYPQRLDESAYGTLLDSAMQQMKDMLVHEVLVLTAIRQSKTRRLNIAIVLAMVAIVLLAIQSGIRYG